ncbi:Cytochrome P450 [Amycolatopsis xylanica]|uniref:Cytochrome P450 n=1 Tax=Amycolatopsis xylanica TaxID=589385 RepID=A0A1H3QUH3_9PSEU|nr:cytochrome P450 [Amycolatopsis xylanica]SDZ16980.1 Cytochrome P450 [Amycolatopsis xylanica]
MTTTLADNWGVHEAQFWLRGKQPEKRVEFSEKSGMWNVYGHQEALRILADPATFSSDFLRVVPEGTFPDQDKDALSAGNLIQLDPPMHTKLRKLVSHAFTPKVVADLEPRIAKVTTELLDAVGGAGRLELVEDLAYPLPVIVIAELLGIPASDRALFKGWVDKLLDNDDEFSLKEPTEKQQKRLKDTMEVRQHLIDYITGHADERRSRPREDLLTKLIEAEVDGESLSPVQVANFANLLLVAGHITTTMLLGNTMLCLDAHPGEWEKARADRSTVPSVIEESLRFLSPFAAVARVTNTEADFGGTVIPPDQMIMVWVAAANRDERTFTNPDTFVATRDPNPHLAFGRGVHFCLGAPLARLEGRVALNLLLDRYPALRSDPDARPEFQPSPNMTGVRKLPLLAG